MYMPTYDKIQLCINMTKIYTFYLYYIKFITSVIIQKKLIHNVQKNKFYQIRNNLMLNVFEYPILH